jgi:hypothetical protein
MRPTTISKVITNIDGRMAAFIRCGRNDKRHYLYFT